MALSASKLKVGETHTARLVDDLKRTQIVQYAGSSGDYNPLHTDEVFTTKVAVDATAVAGIAIGHNSTGVIGLSIATYALGAPILHLVHHRPGNALGSLLLRVALPVAGGGLGWMLTSGTFSPRPSASAIAFIEMPSSSTA